MVIDSHVHLKHGDAAATEYSAQAIVDVMAAAGVDKSVVFAMSTTAARAVELAAAAVEQFPDRLIPYAYALPSYERPVVAELREAFTSRGFRGVKIHAGECRLTEYLIDPVFRLAGECGVPCLVDFGGDLVNASRLARSFPETKLIIAHFGRYLCTDPAVLRSFISLAEECANVWLDCSGMVLPWLIAEAARRIGAERILYGSDGPHPMPDLVSFAREPIRQIRALSLPSEDETLILGGSLAKLLEVD